MSTSERLLAGLVVVLAWLYVPFVAEGSEIPRTALLALATPGMLVLTLPHVREVWASATGAQRVAPVSATAGMLWVAVSTATSDAPWISLTGTGARGVGAIVVLSSLALVVVVPWTIRGLTARRRLVDVLAFVIGSLGVLAILQFVGLAPFGVAGFGGRPVVTLGNPNFTAAAMSLGAPLTTYLWFARPRQRKRALALGASVLFALAAAQALLGWVAAIAGVVGFVLVWVRPGWDHLRGWLIAALPVAAPIAGLVVVGIGSLAGSATARVRTLTWEAAAGMVADQPFTGVGVGRFGAYYRQYRQPEGVVESGADAAADSSHAWLIDLAATTGVVGGALYLCILVAAGLALRQAWLRASEQGPRRAELACLVGLLAAHGVQSSISVPTSLLVWLGGLIVGLALTDDRTVPARASSRRQAPTVVVGAAVLVVVVLAIPVGRWLLAANDLATARSSLVDGRPAVADAHIVDARDRAGWWPTTWLTEARVAEASGDVERGRDATLRAHRADPRDLGAIVGLGLIAALEEDHQTAEDFFELAMARDPHGFEVHFAVARWALQQGRTDLAEQSLDAVEQVIDPSMPEWERLQELRSRL